MYLFSQFQNITNFIFPAKCYICKTVVANNGLCASCFMQLKLPINYCLCCGFEIPLDLPVCTQCYYDTKNKKSKSFNSINFTYTYNYTVYKLISQFKYLDQLNLQNFLVNILQMAVLNKQGLKVLNETDVVIPVPMHYFKLINRRYNHTALLAKEFAKRNQLYFNPFILNKCKYQKAQMTLTGKARLSNIKGSFKLSTKYQHYIKNKNIILIDDVITTGATIDSCCKVLKQNGAKNIYVLAIAKVKGKLKV